MKLIILASTITFDKKNTATETNSALNTNIMITNENHHQYS